MTDAPRPEVRASVEALVDEWLDRSLDDNPAVVGVERGDPDEHLWIARLAGEAKARFAVRFTVGQRTLRAETYVVPLPHAGAEAVFELVLRANAELYGVAFEIGEEAGLYLAGRIDLRWVDEDELDRLLGTLYTATERWFPHLLRAGSFS